MTVMKEVNIAKNVLHPKKQLLQFWLKCTIVVTEKILKYHAYGQIKIHNDAR